SEMGAGRAEGGIRSVPRFENLDEGVLRDVDLADGLHLFLPFLLFLQQLALPRDVPAVALRGDVFAEGADALAGDDLAADGRLDRDGEKLLGDHVAQLRD